MVDTRSSAAAKEAAEKAKASPEISEAEQQNAYLSRGKERIKSLKSRIRNLIMAKMDAAEALDSQKVLELGKEVRHVKDALKAAEEDYEELLQSLDQMDIADGPTRKIAPSGGSLRIPTNLPKFNGYGYAKAEWFLDQFESLLRANQISDVYWSEILQAQMGTQQLMDQVKRLKKEQWAETRAAFLECWAAKRSSMAYRIQLMTIRIGPQESLHNYIARFESLQQRTRGLDSVVLAEHFLGGLLPRPELHARIASPLQATEVRSKKEIELDEALDMARDVAALIEMELGTEAGITTPLVQPVAAEKQQTGVQQHPHTKAGVNAVEVRNNSKTARNRKPFCYNCRQRGHRKQDCPEQGSKKVKFAGVNQVSQERDAADSWIVDIMDDLDEEPEPGINIQQIAASPQQGMATPCVVNGKRVMGLVDSGAIVSVLSRSWCEANHIPVQPSELVLSPAMGKSSQKAGVAEVELQNGTKAITVKLAVAELDNSDFLLGYDLFTTLGFQIMGVPAHWPGQQAADELEEEEPDELRLKLVDQAITDAERKLVMEAWQELIDENQRLPADSSCSHPSALLRINTEQAAPIYVPQYPVRPEFADRVSARVQEWVAKGWVRKIPASNPWCFPLMAAPKKDGNGGMTAMRLCLDLRLLNKVVKDEPFPLPKMQDVMLRLHDAKYFAKFDQADSYHQWKIADEDIGKIAFRWGGQTYAFVRACFGIKTMTALFQQSMVEIFDGIDGLEIYVDDTLVHAKTLPDFIARGREVLQRLNKFQIRLRLEKCTFIADELVNLGRVVGRRGCRPEPVKVAEVINWPLPKTFKQLKSFNCFAGYYRDHIPKFATVIAPLTAVQESKGMITWTVEMKEAFAAVKKLFMEDMTLAFPEMGKPFDVHVDASKVGMGAVVSQMQHGKRRMIVAISRAFRGPELNYSATKKELKAVMWTITKLEQLLMSAKFTLYTDHQALTYLMTQRHDNAMLERWVDRLLRMDFEICHVPGQENVIADALSRQYEAWLFTRKGQPLKERHSIAEIVRSVKTGDSEARELLAATKLGKEIPPLEKRAELLETAHAFGHNGTDRLVQQILDQGWYWQSMHAEAAQLVASCDACLKFNIVQQGYHPEKKSVDATEPWEMIQVDLSVLPKAKTGEQYLLLVTDVFSRLVLIRPLHSKSAKAVAVELWKLIADFGVPTCIQSDQGKEFINEVVEQIRLTFGIQHRIVAAYSHSANGQAERAIRTVNTMLKKELQGKTDDWPEWVPLVQMSANLASNATTKTAPFALMFGRAWKQFENYANARVKIRDEDRSSFKEKLEWISRKVWPAVTEGNDEGKTKSRAYRKNKEKEIKPPAVGDKVYAWVPERKSKWDVVYEGPYEVVGIDDKSCFVLRDGDNQVLGRHVPITHIKLVRGELPTDDTFVIKKILDHRKGKNGHEYLVQWKGYSDSENSWEPEKMFQDWDIIRKYWKEQKGVTRASPGVLEKKSKKPA